ncbi:MAG: tetratricopeptide repeat protein, partial [Terriglobia bacterium]
VVHCDFKPGNVMLVVEGAGDVDSRQTTQSVTQVRSVSEMRAADLRVVITDFGLARALRPSVTRQTIQESLNSDGLLVGTLPYMAPEQLEGRAVTPATDVYALGLVIYEMVTGRRAFSGETPLAVYKRLVEPPTPPGNLAPDLDAGLEAVVLRCLEKEPAARYANANEVAAALAGPVTLSTVRKGRIRASALSVGMTLGLLFLAVVLAALIPSARQAAKNYLFPAPIPLRKNLVVLPFRPVGHGEEEEARCEGFTETVTAKLARAPSVEVAPAESVREHRVDTFDGARTQLGANLVLYASWQQEGNSVTVNLAVVEVDTKHEKQLRTETVNGTIDDVPGLQDQVVLTALRMLQVEVSPAGERELTTHTTTVLASYDFYVQGVGYLQRYERPQNVDLAISLFHRAISADPKYAQAQAALAQAYWYKYSATKDSQWAALAESAVKAAEGLNSRLPEVQLAIGEYYRRTGAYAKAVATFRRAIDLDPASVDGYEGLGFAYDSLGRTAEAEGTFKYALGLRPGCWSCYNALGSFYYDHARYGEAAQAWQKVIALTPDNRWGYENVGAVHLDAGEFETAASFFRRGLKVAPDDPDLNVELGTVLFFERNYEGDARLCERATALSPQKYEYWGNLADAYRMIPSDSAKAADAYRRAAELAREQLRLNPNEPRVVSYLALYSAREGNQAQALQHLAEALKGNSTNVEILYNACLIHLQAGEKQQALKWLAQAVRAGYPRGLVADPQLDSLHSEPAFAALTQESRTYR